MCAGQWPASPLVPVVMTSLLPPLCIDEASLKHAARVQRVQSMHPLKGERLAAAG